MSTLRDFLERAAFLFVKDFRVADDVRLEHLAKDMSREFTLLADRLEKAEPFDHATTEKIFREVVAELGIQSGELVHPTRVALTNSAVGPGLFETMVVLGRERTVERLHKAFVTDGKTA